MTESARDTSLAWRKSSYSETTACVTVASDGRAVLIRDSATPGTLTLQIPLSAWLAFLETTQGR